MLIANPPVSHSFLWAATAHSLHLSGLLRGNLKKSQSFLFPYVVRTFNNTTVLHHLQAFPPGGVVWLHVISLKLKFLHTLIVYLCIIKQQGQSNQDLTHGRMWHELHVNAVPLALTPSALVYPDRCLSCHITQITTPDNTYLSSG